MKSRKITPRGFTLLELLVVMTIIAVLAGGIFAAAQFALRKARSVQAQNMAVGLVNAITNFRSDYGRWPAKGEQHKSNSTFMAPLLGRDTSVNKRGRNFVDSMPVAKGNPPVNGLYYQGNTADLLDPWGNNFTIHIDDNGDGQVSNPDSVSGGTGTSGPLYLKVAVVSAGVDKMMSGQNDEGQDATKDNVRSW